MIYHALRTFCLLGLFAACANVQAQKAYFVYLNDGSCEAFLRNEVDSITVDPTSQTQSFWIGGKAYSFNLEDTKKIDFLTPPTKPTLVVSRKPVVTKRFATLRAELIGADPERTYYPGLAVNNGTCEGSIEYDPRQHLLGSIEGESFEFDYTLTHLHDNGSWRIFNVYYHENLGDYDYSYKFSLVDDLGNYYPCTSEAPDTAYTFHFLPDELTEGDEVDLGQGLIWRSRNLGAESITDEGDRYAWAILNPGGEYSHIDDYPYTFWENGYLHYSHFDFDISGSESYDAARHQLGGDWRIPSLEEWAQMFKTCWIEPYIYEGVQGVLVTGSNGMGQMFIPTPSGAAILWTSTEAESIGHYMYTDWPNACLALISIKETGTEVISGSATAKDNPQFIRPVKTKK